MKNKKGFTLIELLIVIGIIAILAAAVIIAINPGRQFEQARNATRWSHMNSAMNAIYSYAITEGGVYPDCVPDDESVIDLAACDLELVHGGEEGSFDGFVSSLPEDPSLPAGGTYSDATLDSNDWESSEISYTCDPGAPELDYCTGYIIGFTDNDQNRVRIISFLNDGEAQGVTVVQ